MSANTEFRECIRYLKCYEVNESARAEINEKLSNFETLIDGFINQATLLRETAKDSEKEANKKLKQTWDDFIVYETTEIGELKEMESKISNETNLHAIDTLNASLEEKISPLETRESREIASLRENLEKLQVKLERRMREKDKEFNAACVRLQDEKFKVKDVTNAALKQLEESVIASAKEIDTLLEQKLLVKQQEIINIRKELEEKMSIQKEEFEKEVVENKHVWNHSEKELKKDLEKEVRDLESMVASLPGKLEQTKLDLETNVSEIQSEINTQEEEATKLQTAIEIELKISATLQTKLSEAQNNIRSTSNIISKEKQSIKKAATKKEKVNKHNEKEKNTCAEMVVVLQNEKSQTEEEISALLMTIQKEIFLQTLTSTENQTQLITETKAAVHRLLEVLNLGRKIDIFK